MKMNAGMTREQALAAVLKTNHEPFHRLHALTVEAVMRHMAKELGEDPEFWGIAGLLHDIDFELYPEQHCVACIPMLREIGATDELIHAVCSHGWSICSQVEPTLLMENVLFACDELTGLIGAAARMRPSKSCTDMELSSLKKKYKDKRFAAGCSRDIISLGAERLGWTLDELLQRTLAAMAATEASVNAEAAALPAD